MNPNGERGTNKSAFSHTDLVFSWIMHYFPASPSWRFLIPLPELCWNTWNSSHFLWNTKNSRTYRLQRSVYCKQKKAWRSQAYAGRGCRCTPSLLLEKKFCMAFGYHSTRKIQFNWIIGCVRLLIQIPDAIDEPASVKSIRIGELGWSHQQPNDWCEFKSPLPNAPIISPALHTYLC